MALPVGVALAGLLLPVILVTQGAEPVEQPWAGAVPHDRVVRNHPLASATVPGDWPAPAEHTRLPNRPE